MADLREDERIARIRVALKLTPLDHEPEFQEALAALSSLAADLSRLQTERRAIERERDELGPLFVRDMCRLLEVADDDPYRLDSAGKRLESVAAERDTALRALELQRKAIAWVAELLASGLDDHNTGRESRGWGEVSAAFGEVKTILLAAAGEPRE